MHQTNCTKERSCLLRFYRVGLVPTNCFNL